MTLPTIPLIVCELSGSDQYTGIIVGIFAFILVYDSGRTQVVYTIIRTWHRLFLFSLALFCYVCLNVVLQKDG